MDPTTCRLQWAVVALVFLLEPAALPEDAFARQGVPCPLERDERRVAVKPRAASTLRVGDFTLGGRVERYLSQRAGVAILEVDPAVESLDSAINRLRADADLEYAAPIYRGEGGLALAVSPEAIVRFRPSVDAGAREDFYALYDLEPQYEYPPGSGRVICQVVEGQRSRETLDVVTRAYFDERVQHVSPGFLRETRLTGDCYDSAYVPPGCSHMGPGGIDCPPIDPDPCIPATTCPSCQCARRSTMTLPQGPGDDEFADEFHQFEHMGIWDAWSITRGHSGVNILVTDSRVDRDHRDVGPQVVLDLEPSNVRADWHKSPSPTTFEGSNYAVALAPQATAPRWIYFHFVDPPNPRVSGTTIGFHIDNFKVQVDGPQGAMLRNYSFDDGDQYWQSEFSSPAGSNHACSRKTVAESGCASSPGGTEYPALGTHVLRVEATGAGDRSTHQVRVAVPGLQAGRAYYVTVDWIPFCPGYSGYPPLEGFLRFGIDGDMFCPLDPAEIRPARFGGEMGRDLEKTHGTTVSVIACGADNPDGFGVIGVAPDCRVIAVSASYPLLQGADATALLAAGAAGASVVSCSAQLGILDDDYLDAYRALARFSRNGKGAPFSFSAGNDGAFVHPSWISATELSTSVGALALVTPTSGEPYWSRGCISSYGADVWVLDHRVFQVNASWGYESYGFTAADSEGADGSLPGDFLHYDEVELAHRRVQTSTSWCAPVVSGIYGLLLSRDLDLTREEATQILYHTAKRPDAAGRIDGMYLDCALPGGPCFDGVDPSPGCTAFPSTEEDVNHVDPESDIPFDPVTSRSRVFGYGLVDALAAVEACDPESPKRWPAPPYSISVTPGKTTSGSRRVRVSWIPHDTNRVPRDYDGYILVRTIGGQLVAAPTDGTAPPGVGEAWANGVVVAKGEAAAGTPSSSYEDTSTTQGLRCYALFYYRKLAGPQDFYYSFGKEGRIVYETARWKTVTTYSSLAAEIAAGLDSSDPSKAVVLFVDNSSGITLPSCLELGTNIRGSEATGRVYIVGDKNLGGTKTRLIVPSAATGMAICGSRHLSVSGFTIEGGTIGLGVWKSGGATGGCPTACTGDVRADEIQVWNCRFEGNQIGAWLDNEGDVVLQNNVIRATGMPTHPQAAGLYFPSRSPVTADFRTLYSILNNTIDVAGRPCLRIYMQSLSSGFNANHRPRLQVFNNILRASGSGGVCVEHGSASGWHLSNYNDFVIVAPASCGRIEGGASYASLEAWRPEARSDKHSLSVDPGFVNVGTGDYHLASKLSPMINAGTTEVYEPRFLAFEFDLWSKTRIRSGSAHGGTYRPWHLGIDIGADERDGTTQALDADLGLPFLRGDANNDRAVDMSDTLFVLNFLFYGGAAPVCFDAADANDDEMVNISDSLTIYNYLFNPGESEFSALPPPHPFCGFDVYRLGDDAAPPEQSPYHCDDPATLCP